jgi:hypothetical protein
MNGWLSPRARFFPCKVGEHGDEIKKLPTKPGQTWVAIHPQGAFSERPLTRMQIKWLQKSLTVIRDFQYKELVEWLLEKQEELRNVGNDN